MCVGISRWSPRAALLLALSVTALDKSRGAWNVTFSEVLRVDGIEKNKTSFKMPLAGSRKREFADVRILDEALYAQVLTSLEERLPPEREPGVRFRRRPEFEVTSARSFDERELSGPRRAGDVVVVFENSLRVRFAVMIAGKKTWVAYPGRKRWRKWRAQFTILDQAYRERVETAVLDAWREASGP